VKSLLVEHRFSTYDEMVSVMTALKMPVPLADGLLNIDGSLDAKRQAFSMSYEAFLKSTYNESFYRNFMQQRKTEVSKALTDAWQSCLKTASSAYLDQKGILIAVTPFDAMRKFTVDIRVRVPAGTRPKILQIAPAGEVACSSNTGVPIPANFVMPLTEFRMTCTKDGGKAIPFSITVDPGGMAKTITIPSQTDRITELVLLAQVLQADVTLLKSQLSAAASELTKQIGEAKGMIPKGIKVTPGSRAGFANHNAVSGCSSVVTGVILGMSARDIDAVCGTLELIR
jgi:hypothetical protein